MTAQITCEIDGVSMTVDLYRVTARDALAYRSVAGEDIDGRLGVLLTLDGAEPTLADKALIKWLWMRQSGQPNVHLSAVAGQMRLLPTPVRDSAEGGE